MKNKERECFKESVNIMKRGTFKLREKASSREGERNYEIKLERKIEKERRESVF